MDSEIPRRMSEEEARDQTDRQDESAAPHPHQHWVLCPLLYLALHRHPWHPSLSPLPILLLVSDVELPRAAGKVLGHSVYARGHVSGGQTW